MIGMCGPHSTASIITKLNFSPYIGLCLKASISWIQLCYIFGKFQSHFATEKTTILDMWNPKSWNCSKKVGIIQRNILYYHWSHPLSLESHMATRPTSILQRIQPPHATVDNYNSSTRKKKYKRNCSLMQRIVPPSRKELFPLQMTHTNLGANVVYAVSPANSSSPLV